MCQSTPRVQDLKPAHQSASSSQNPRPHRKHTSANNYTRHTLPECPPALNPINRRDRIGQTGVETACGGMQDLHAGLATVSQPRQPNAFLTKSFTPKNQKTKIHTLSKSTGYITECSCKMRSSARVPRLIISSAPDSSPLNVPLSLQKHQQAYCGRGHNSKEALRN